MSAGGRGSYMLTMWATFRPRTQSLWRLHRRRSPVTRGPAHRQGCLPGPGTRNGEGAPSRGHPEAGADDGVAGRHPGADIVTELQGLTFLVLTDAESRLIREQLDPMPGRTNSAEHQAQALAAYNRGVRRGLERI